MVERNLWWTDPFNLNRLAIVIQNCNTVQAAAWYVTSYSEFVRELLTDIHDFLIYLINFDPSDEKKCYQKESQKDWEKKLQKHSEVILITHVKNK